MDEMKFTVLIGDGMGDYPRNDLGGKTVLEVRRHPIWIGLPPMAEEVLLKLSHHL